MVVDGQDKFYRQCSYRCKDRDERDYVNYDQSSSSIKNMIYKEMDVDLHKLIVLKIVIKH